MTSVNWLIEDFERDNSFNELADEVKRQGYDCEVVRYQPFITQPNFLNLFPPDACVIFQGSIGMARQIDRNGRWLPGTIATWRNYACRRYYSFLGPWLLQDKYLMLPFAEFKRRFSDLLIDFQGQFFLRPDDGAKSFTGFVANQDNMTPNMWAYIESDIEPWGLVVVSPVKSIHREWRLICDNSVLTGSRYKTHGMPDFNPDVPQKVIDFANDLLSKVTWRPDPIFVLDVCETKDSLHVLEIGALSVAGLYKCDLGVIVKRVSEISFKMWEEIYGDV